MSKIRNNAIVCNYYDEILWSKINVKRAEYTEISAVRFLFLQQAKHNELPFKLDRSPLLLLPPNLRHIFLVNDRNAQILRLSQIFQEPSANCMVMYCRKSTFCPGSSSKS